MCATDRDFIRVLVIDNCGACAKVCLEAAELDHIFSWNVAEVKQAKPLESFKVLPLLWEDRVTSKALGLFRKFMWPPQLLVLSEAKVIQMWDGAHRAAQKPGEMEMPGPCFRPRWDLSHRCLLKWELEVLCLKCEVQVFIDSTGFTLQGALE